MLLIIGSNAREATEKAAFLFRRAFKVEDPVYLGEGAMEFAQLNLDPLDGNAQREPGLPRSGPFLPRIIENIRQSCLPWRYHPNRTRVICDASKESRLVLEALMSFPWLLPPDSFICVLRPPPVAAKKATKQHEELLGFIKDSLLRRVWQSPDYHGLEDQHKPTVEAFWLSHVILNDVTVQPDNEVIQTEPPLVVFACNERVRKRLGKNMPSVSYDSITYNPARGMDLCGQVWSCKKGRHVLLVWDLDEYHSLDVGNQLRAISEYSRSTVWGIIGLASPGMGAEKQAASLMGLAKYPFEMMASPELITGEESGYYQQTLDVKYSRMRKAVWRWLKEWEVHHRIFPVSSE